MKHFLLLLYLIVPAICFSQTENCLDVALQKMQMEKQHPRPRPYKGRTIILFASSIILNGIGDGLNDSGRKTAGHFFNAASIATLLSVPFLTNVDKKKWYIYALSYTSLRIGLFDGTYNVTRGLDVNYIGCTSPTDKMMRKTNWKSGYAAKGLFIGIGVALPLWVLE